MNNINCEFVETGSYFNDKPVYMCAYCGIRLCLDDPNIDILCFKKMIDAKNEIRKFHNADPLNVESTTLDNLQNFIHDKITQKSLHPENQTDMCSNSQIQDRLKICESCEHYKNDLCELCGCQIVREQNYMNKLAHKSASCPIGKWLAIIN